MDHMEPASIEFHSYQQSSSSPPSSILSSFTFQKLSETVFIILLNILKMFWNTMFQPLPYYTAPTTPNSRLLTPLVYLYWAVMCCVLLPLAPIYLFTSLMGTIYISTQMGWRLKQTKPEVIEDIKKRYLAFVPATPVPEHTPSAEPAPVTESPPVTEANPIVVEPVQTVAVEGVVEEKQKGEDDAAIVPHTVVEEPEAEEVVDSAIEPTLRVEEESPELIPPVHEEAQTETPIRETHEETPQVLAKQESLTVREYSSPIVAGPDIEDVEESCGMESKYTESAPSDYSGSASSDIEESDEDELGEKKHNEGRGLEGIVEEEEADEEILRKDLDEREVSDQELTPQAPEYIPPAHQVKLEEPVFVRSYGPPAFGICEKRGVREIVDPRKRHSHQARIQQPVSSRMEESLASSDESSPYDDESERDGSPPVSPISSVGTGNWGVIIESLDKIVELDIGADKAESPKDDVDTSVTPAPLDPQKLEAPQVTEDVSPCVAPVQLVPTTTGQEKQAAIVSEQTLMPVVEIAPKLERSNTDDSGFESGSVKEVKVQKKKKKAPMKQRLGNRKSKRSW
ncbi:hypothetical protein HOY82DRAFT_189433 [Tuber indicum]|nr:hypothetical protein HOY82DRAFT_189433 [Tuber indicum]